MKIKEIYITDPYGEADQFAIYVDDKFFCNAGGGEPEDNSIGRDLNFVFGIGGLAKKAHAAGASGESITVERVEMTREEYDEWCD